MTTSSSVRRVATPAFDAFAYLKQLSRRGSALRLLPVCALAVGGAARAATIAYDGGPSATGADWGTAANWAGDVLPTSADTASFATANTTLTVSLGANREVAQLSFGNSNAAYTIGSAADVSAGNIITLGNVRRDRVAGSMQTIAVGVALSNATSIWDIHAGFNNGVTVSGVISGSGKRLEKWAGGTLTLENANTFDGGLAVNFGTVSLNLNGTTAPTANIVSSANTLTIGNGTLSLTGKNGQSTSQTFAGTQLNAGQSAFAIANGTTANTRTALNLGAISRSTGATVNFAQPTGTGNTTVAANNGYITSTANDASGILGAYATVGGTDWAANNGTNIVAYTGYTTLAGATPSIADGATTNISVTSGSTGDVGQASGTTTVNTLRVNDASARVITVGAGNTLRLGATGGILSTGAGGLTIGASGNGGTLTAGGADNTAGELIFQNSSAVTVNSVIADNGTGAVALVKSGSGTTTLNAGPTHTGGTFVNQGTLTLGTGVALPTSGAVTVGGIYGSAGTLNLGGNTQNLSGALVLGGGSLNSSGTGIGGTISNGTINKTGSDIDARGGVISAVITGTAGIAKTTPGTLTLTNATSNTFTGDTTITEGAIVSATGANGRIAISGNLIIGSPGGGNAASFSQSNGTFSSSKNLTIYSNGTASLGSQAQTLNGTVSILGGTLNGTQIGQGTTINMTGGTLSGAVTSGGNNSFNILASSETAIVSANMSSSGPTNRTWTVADGDAAVDMLFSGNITATGTATFTKAGAGVLSFTGTSATTGAVTVSGGTLSVTSLADNGVASAIGASTSAATGLILGNGTTLQYTGTGHSTNRLFTVNGSAATLKASGTGAASFTNTGNIAWGSSNQARTLNLGGTGTADNTLSALIANNGSGAVSLTKQDSGTWVLTNNHTYTGATRVEGGRLKLGSAASLSSASAVIISAGAVFDTSAKSALTLGTGGLTFSVDSSGAGLFDAGVSEVAFGNALTFDFAGSSFAASYDVFDFGSHTGNFSSVSLTGSIVGTLLRNEETDTWSGVIGDYSLSFNEASGLLSIGSAIPEPSAFALIGGVAALGGALGRRRRRTAA